MKKRLISFLLILSMALSIMPLIASAVPAVRSNAQFRVNGNLVSVPATYMINGSNYLSLRGIAMLLNGTAAQFNVSWDGTYVSVETGKPYTGDDVSQGLPNTSEASWIGEGYFIYLDGKLYGDFNDVWTIDGRTYVQLREFAERMNGRSSQFNVYWEEAIGQIVIEPGQWYTGISPNYVGTAPSIDMVHVPAGTHYLTSRTIGEELKDLTATLTKGYYIGKHEITQKQYREVMGINPSYFNGADEDWVGKIWDEYAYIFDLTKSSGNVPRTPIGDDRQENRPVENVSWYDALVFCNRLSILTGLTPVYTIKGTTDPKGWGFVPDATWDRVSVNWDANGYRLPTEAEWQIACLAGTKTRFSFGDDMSKAEDYAWSVKNASIEIVSIEEGYTREVGKKLPNPWGIHDMHGNVAEWCWDWLNLSHAFPVGVVDPIGPTIDVSGVYRSVRGGNTDSSVSSSFERDMGRRPDSKNDLIGFRVVRNDNNQRIAPPVDLPGLQWEGFYLVNSPYKLIYKVGEGFDISDLLVHYQDRYGYRRVVDHSELKFYTSGTVELTTGRPFTTEGVKKIEIRHNDGEAKWFQGTSSFEVLVISDSEDKILETGNYYLKIYDKYIYPVAASGVLYMELWDKKPEHPFTIKLTNYSEDRGPQYTISYDGTYVVQPTSSNGAQLVTNPSIPHRWRINQYSSFITIRDYGNQKLMVNASGNKSENGTKVTVWTYQGSAPEHGKIKLIKAE